MNLRGYLSTIRLPGLLFLALAALMIARNTWLFGPPIYEAGDAAANSILVEQARHLSLLVGNYSRVGFNHPGPFFMYVQAAGDVVFYRVLGIVNSSYAGQVLGLILLSAFLVAASIHLLVAQRRTLDYALACVAFAAYLLLSQSFGNPDMLKPSWLGSSWMPAVYCAPFLLFMCAVAVCARGEARALPWLAFSGAALVHGHVSFVMIVCLMTCLGLVAGCVSDGGFRWLHDRRRLLVSAAILGIFILPIALHTLIDFPGEIGLYLHYARNHSSAPHQGGVKRFLLHFLGGDKRRAFNPIALTIIAIYAWAIASRRLRKPAAASLLAVLAATLATAIYAKTGIDNLAFTYTAWFYSVTGLFVFISLSQFLAAYCQMRPAYLAMASLLVSMAAAVCLVNIRFESRYRGDPALPVLLAKLKTDFPPGLHALRFRHDDWPVATGLVANGMREGISICIDDAQWQFMFTRRLICSNSKQAPVDHLDLNANGGTSYALTPAPSKP